MSPAQKMMRLVIIGFTAILILLLAGTGVGIVYITSVNERLNNVIKQHNIKLNLTHKMLEVLQHRQFRLYTFFLQEDVFVREKIREDYLGLAGEYLKARETLLSMTLDEKINAEINRLDKLTSSTQRVQFLAMEGVEGGNKEAATEILLNTVWPLQNQVLAQIGHLVRMHEEQSDEAIAEAERSYHNAKLLMLPLGIGVILLGLIIAWQISRNAKDFTQTLENEQNRYKSLFQGGFDAVMLWDNGKLIDCNSAALKLFRFSSYEQFHNINLLDLLPEKQDDGVPSDYLLNRKMNEAMAQSSSYFEWQHKRLDGKLFPAEVVIYPVCIAGKPVLQIVVRDISERKEAEQRIEYLAYHDALTDLPNQSLFKDRLELCIANAHRNRQKLAVMLLDLDRFKTINSSLGHYIGDELLKQLARRLENFMPEGSTVARMGGDNFMLLLTEPGNIEAAVKFAEQVLALITRPFSIEQHTLHATASIGIVMYPDDGDNLEKLLKHADNAMYQAKAAGGNIYYLYTDQMNYTVYKHMMLENAMQRGIDRKEFMLYYQPKVETRNGRVIGMEALVRWQHPDMGFLGPQEFIGIAEQSNLIYPLSEWIIHTACMDMKSFRQKGFDLRVSINLSVKQFQNDTLLPYVKRVLEATGLDPACVEFEITESTTLNAEEESLAILRALKSTGVHLSIDDFGTGYSSLSYLKKYPIDVLKIDKSFVDGLPGDTNNIAISGAIINIAHSLGYAVVAEGVETTRQLEFMRQRACYAIQGYLAGKPMPLHEFERYVQHYQGKNVFTHTPFSTGD